MPRRVYMWIPPGECHSNTFHKMPRGVRGRPDKVWTMLRCHDEKDPPSPQKPLTHGVTAFLEDPVHDWNWYETRPGEIKFYSRITTGGIWIALIFEDGKPEKLGNCKVCKVPLLGLYCHHCGRQGDET